MHKTIPSIKHEWINGKETLFDKKKNINKIRINFVRNDNYYYLIKASCRTQEKVNYSINDNDNNDDEER